VKEQSPCFEAWLCHGGGLCRVEAAWWRHLDANSAVVTFTEISP